MGLYDPKHEHDSCGLGFIANFKGKKSHKIVQDGIKILENLGAIISIGDHQHRTPLEIFIPYFKKVLIEINQLKID